MRKEKPIVVSDQQLIRLLKDANKKLGDHARLITEQLADIQKQVTTLRSYLEAIIDPIAYMRSKLENGQRLNGQMAIQLSENHSYLKGLAKKALAATETTAGASS